MLREKCNKYVILFAIQILIVLALIPGCFRKEQLVYSHTNEDLNVLGVYTEDRAFMKGDYMTLSPGVYQVRIWSDVSENQRMSVELSYESGSFRAIRTNAVTVFPGDEYIDFEAYVSDELSTVYLQFEFTNMDASGVNRVDVWRTSMGNRIMLFVVTIGFLVLDGMLLFRKRILEGKVSKEQQVVFWVLAAGVLLAYFPFLTDYTFLGGDTAFHLSRIAYLKDSLLYGGQFPVRVQSTWLFDHGYPVSLFYGDLFLYVPAFFMIVGFSLMSAYKMFVFLIMVSTALIAYFSFKKCVNDRYAALFGSMIYILAPYRLLNLYGRGALGEFLAMTFLPLICCGMYLLYAESPSSGNYKVYKWYIVLGMSGVVQCHLLSLEMVTVMIAMVCVLLCRKTFQKQTFLQLLETVGLTVLINAWFLVPLFSMLISDVYNVSNLGAESIESRGLILGELFQFLPRRDSIPLGKWGHVPAQIGVGPVMLLVVYIIWHIKKRKRNVECNIFVGLTMLTIFLCTDMIPWDNIKEMPVMGYMVSTLQFPWRFMSMASVFVAMFASLFYLYVNKKGGLLVKTALGIAGVAVVVTAVFYVNSVALEESAIFIYEEENIGTAKVVSAEYLLIGNNMPDYHYHAPVAEEGLNWSDYKQEGTNVSIWLQNNIGRVGYIEIPLIGYKGYELDIEGSGEMPYIAAERGAHGDLRIAVPAGYEGVVKIYYKGFALFRVAEIISVISILITAVWYFYRKGKKLRNE